MKRKDHPEKEKELLKKVRTEYGLFRYRMLLCLVQEVYNSCRVICFLKAEIKIKEAEAKIKDTEAKIKIKGMKDTVILLRSLGHNDSAIRTAIMKQYHLSEEEVNGYL